MDLTTESENATADRTQTFAACAARSGGAPPTDMNSSTSAGTFARSSSRTAAAVPISAMENVYALEVIARGSGCKRKW